MDSARLRHPKQCGAEIAAPVTLAYVTGGGGVRCPTRERRDVHDDDHHYHYHNHLHCCHHLRDTAPEASVLTENVHTSRASLQQQVARSQEIPAASHQRIRLHLPASPVKLKYWESPYHQRQKRMNIHIHTHNNSLSENVSQLLYTRGVCSNEVYFVPKPSICYNTRASRVPASHTQTHTHTHTNRTMHALLCRVMKEERSGERWGRVWKGDIQV